MKPIFNYDKLIHIAEYAILSLLLYFAVRNSFNLKDYRWIALIAVIGSTLYGISDEYHQSFVRERVADHLDVAADAFGAALMQTLLYIKNRFLAGFLK